MPGCYPYGVRAMWSERSRHMRGGAVLGSSGKVAGLAVRFLPAALAPVSLMSRARKRTARPATFPLDPRTAPPRIWRLLSDHMARTPYG